MGNQGFLDCGLVDVLNHPVNDPSTDVTLFSGHGSGRVVYDEQGLSFAPRRKFKLPAFPQSDFLHGVIAPSRFRPRTIGSFRLTDGEVVVRNLTVLRDPGSWKASFVRWGDLSSHFRRFQRVLERSPDVLIRGGKSYGRFTDISYDGVADELTVRAKAALLNLFAKLTSMPKAPGSSVDWFSWIRQIATFGRERLVAIVAPEMAKAVRDIKSDLPKHEFYKHTAAENHYKNFPERYHPLKSKMYSIKTDEDHGNLQITIAPGTDPDSGGELFLADIDIDENGKLLRHLVDVFLVHHFSGGTHPFDIHEYLHLAYPKVELGYQLV